VRYHWYRFTDDTYVIRYHRYRIFVGENGTTMMVSRGGILLSSTGTNVTMHCVVSGTSWNPFFDQIIWYKVRVTVGNTKSV